MTGLGDWKFAADLRDLVRKIATTVVQETVPEVRMGTVYRADPDNGWCWVLFPGETVENLVKVRCAQDKVPSRYMETDFATLGYDAQGDIVRVWGKPGGYFLLDFYTGKPSDSHRVHTGMILLWGADEVVPAGWLKVQGQTLNVVDYPALYLHYGNKYGGTPGVDFLLPNARDRFIIGASATRPLAATGGSVSRTLVEANIPAHSHFAGTLKASATIRENADSTGAQNNLTAPGGTAGSVETREYDIAGSTSSVGSGTSFEIMPPWLALDFIVKT